MKLYQLRQEQLLPVTLDEAWAFFSNPGNLAEITPPDLGFAVDHLDPGPMEEGQIISYRVKIAPGLWMPWVTEIKAVRERHSFIDEQRFGPYKFWHHRHLFEEVAGGVLMKDRVFYGLPFGPFGRIAHALFVHRKMRGIFASRREILDRRFGRGA
jgi:ligand-binding SRPBCC domain-containing protein